MDIYSIRAGPFLINASKKHGGTVFSASIKEIDKLLAWYKRNPGEEVTISSINAEADQYNDKTLKRLIPEWAYESFGAFKKKKLEELP